MRILNFGSLNWDKTYRVPHFVRGGETICALALTQSPRRQRAEPIGGAGGARARTLRTRGAVGADGAPLRALLEAAGRGHLPPAHGRRGERARGDPTVRRRELHHRIRLGRTGRPCRRMWTRSLRDTAPATCCWCRTRPRACRTRCAARRRRAWPRRAQPLPHRRNAHARRARAGGRAVCQRDEAGALTGADAQDADALLRALAARFPAAQLVLTLGEKGRGVSKRRRALIPARLSRHRGGHHRRGDTFTGFFPGGDGAKPAAQNLPALRGPCRGTGRQPARRGGQHPHLGADEGLRRSVRRGHAGAVTRRFSPEMPAGPHIEKEGTARRPLFFRVFRAFSRRFTAAPP